MAKQVAMILSGCGVYDGTEIHEAVLTLLALERNGAEVQCFAPDVPQMHVIDHLTRDVSSESRNVLVESARIARGKVVALSEYRVADFDALLFPGGFGAVKNLCNFDVAGVDCEVEEEVARAVRETREAGKPIGALCISPIILAKLLPEVSITLGADGPKAADARKLGARHTVTTHGEIVVDEEQRVVSGPCYMLDANIAQIADDAEKVVERVLAMA